MSARKIAKARKISPLGCYGRTWEALIAEVPAHVLEQITAAALDLVGAIYLGWRCSHAIAIREACDEGAIWDERARSSRTLGPRAA